jgi:VIT1/CCC1 family predicted Fe2+/Mn2+ transporter
MPHEPPRPHGEAGVGGSAEGRLLDPIERVSEVMFGLIMAVTIVGSLSIATAGRQDVRSVMIAALGCNLAWGLVDAVMYLVRTLTERKRNVALARRVIGAAADTARGAIASALPEHVAAMVGESELEGMRQRLLASQLSRGGLRGQDYFAAIGIFLWVVVATFPVVIPFFLTDDAAVAMQVSRMITLVMLFIAGNVLGRYAGHARPVVTGLMMLLLGAALITAVKALGG